MLSWWMDVEAVASLSDLMLFATLTFATLTGIMAFLSTGKSKAREKSLSEALETTRKQVKSIKKTAETIRKELLETQQHQDINQLKLKTSDSSAAELRQALLDAKKRLEIAESAVKAHKQQANAGDEGTGDDILLDLELEPEGGLSENQREQLIDLLDPGPKGNIDMFCVMGNRGSELMATQLEEILANDGWKTNGVAQSAFSNLPKGIVLAVNGKETAPSYASFLQRVFATIGLPVSAKFDNKYREWSLTIIVGATDN
jgi:hypothetical protein